MDRAVRGLSALFAGRLPARVYRWCPGQGDGEVAGAADLAVLAGNAGWAVRHVDAAARTKADVLAAVGEALRFPETYGRNLDALADLLDDLAGPTALVWDAWSALAQEDPRTFATLLQVFAERCDDARRPPFAVLLTGKGEVQLDLPQLD